MRAAMKCTPLIALIVLSCGVARVLAQGPAFGSIVGQLQVVRGSFPSRPVLITLRSRGIDAARLYADNEGRFGFNQLPGNQYHVIIDDPEYAPVDIRVDLDPSAGAVKMINITLVPTSEIKTPRPDTGDRVPGNNPNVVSPNEPGRNIPDSAFREFQAGVAAEKKSRRDEAIEHYERAIHIAPNFYQARNNMGIVYLAKSDWEQAKRQFEEVIRLNPAEASAYFNLANLLLLSKKPTEAVETARKGLRLEPNSAFGQFVFGSALGRTGDKHNAERALHRALELDPAQARAHLELVNLYLSSGQKDAAIAELRTFLHVAPDDPFAPKAREALAKLEAEADEKSKH